MRYEIEFAESVKDQIKRFPARQRALILDQIEEHLSHQPVIETRNRKPLRPNPLASWELRIGSVRVFYDVVSEASSEFGEPSLVQILAIGQKNGNKLLIAGKEVSL
ncbi:MAG: type II toxin-antitoxin system RelE/ParE family toxin [Candidatus Sumerlaeota bacterium]|nr:type II toxin-antitoxin system RelE/ParE family toxin [Candidatus Sumerlaeota bacterium]